MLHFLLLTTYLLCLVDVFFKTAGDFGDRVYPIELEIKDITDTVMSTSYLGLRQKVTVSVV
jgi:hypothetical protein